MRKSLFKLACFMLLSGIMLPFVSRASHNVGGEITYTYTGIPNTFLITYKFYRDCSGIPAPTQISLCYSSVNCGQNGTIDLFPIAGTGNEIPPSPCVPPPTGGSTCNGGTGYGVQEHIFEATLVLPMECTDWKFDYSECCRNTISTIQGQPGLYLLTTLNNDSFPTNSSPYFTTIPVTQFCVNNQFYFDQGAFDIDGDSLVYSLINGQDANGGCPYTPFDIPYVAPYSGINPLQTASGTTIDPFTGVIAFVPTLIQNGVIAVRCTEFDRATQQIKSTIKREIQVNVVNTCIIAPPSFDSTFQANGVNIVIDGVINAACDDSVFYLTLSPPIQCGSIVPSDIRFTDPFGVSNPVSSAIGINCVNGLTDSIQVTLINPITLGTSYIITKTGFDGNTFLSECGSPMAELDTLFINLVDSSAYNFQVNDTADCAFDSLVVSCNQQITCASLAGDGSEFVLIDANGDTIPITGTNCIGLLPGGLFNNEFVIYAQPLATTIGPLTLIVKDGLDTNTFSNACRTFVLENDTIGQIYLRNNINVNLGSDVTACASDPTPQLTAGVYNGAMYTWALNGSSTATDTSAILATSSGQYVLTVTSSASCFGSDTVDVNILAAPVVNLGNDVTYCAGDPIQSLNAQNAGASFQWYLNNNAIAGATDSVYTPTAAGIYSVAVNVGVNCLGRDTVEIAVVAQLNVSVSDLAFCAGSGATLQSNSGSPGVTYSWTLNGSSLAGQTGTSIPVNQTGTYAVQISTGNCSANDSANVTAIDVPTATLSNIAQCDNYPTLDPLYPINPTYNTSYAWTLGGSSTGSNTPTLATTQNGNYTVVITNTFGGVVCTATASSTVQVNQTPVITGISDDVRICVDANPTPTPLTVTTSATGATYQWLLNGNIINGATNDSYTANATGTYQVNVIGAGSCQSDTSVNVVFGINPDVTIQDSVTAEQSEVLFCKGQNQPNLILVTVVEGLTYNWSYLGLPISNNTSASVDSIGVYSVIVTNAAGCSATDEIAVVPGICDVIVPNVFTPDADGKNDTFEIPNLLDYEGRKLTIYNRWGNEVYKADKYNNNWTGGDLPAGVYFYSLELFNGIKSSTKNGNVQIIK